MILNLTQHPATAEQLSAGVVDLDPAERAELCGLLTFDILPSREEILARAEAVATLAAINAAGEDRDGGGGLALSAMIGGAPFFMAPLETALRAQGIEPVYAFSRREAAEQMLPDGSVKKTQVFRHAGFVPAMSA